MLTKAFVAASFLAASVSAASKGYNPFPLADGFPSPNAAQLRGIERRAGGSLPNGPLPTKLTNGGTVALQLIAVQEQFEVAYFNSLLHNITHDVPGYKLKSGEKKFAIKVFTEILAQEELHAIGANAILANAHRETIKPCRYTFPVTTFADAVGLAATFTDLVLSVLPTVQTSFAEDGGQEIGLINLIGSIIAQEGEQDGWFRATAGKVPSAAPFLTGSNAAFAASAAAQNFLVPGSCPNIDNIVKNLPIYAPLTVVKGTKASDTTVTYSVKGKLSKKNMLAYLSGQNLPVVVDIKNAKYSKGVTTFQAELPFSSKGFAKGLTVAAVVKNCDKFANAAQVAANTVYGPGLIEIE